MDDEDVDGSSVGVGGALSRAVEGGGQKVVGINQTKGREVGNLSNSKRRRHPQQRDVERSDERRCNWTILLHTGPWKVSRDW